MNIEIIRDYCLKKKAVTEDFPFDENVLVFRVLKKIFLLCDLKEPDSINLKCAPELAAELREKYAEILPGYHMNKKHWNTVFIDKNIPAKEIFAMIDHSYEQVIKGLKGTDRKKLL